MRSSRYQVWRHDRGLTLIEVLVVLGILILLVVIAVPAILVSRESARRSTCKNNLKSIGLALHNYHETYSLFPMPYMIGAGNPLFTPPFNLNAQSYGTMLLTFLDSSPTYSRMNFTTPCYSANGIANVNAIVARWGRPPHNVAAAVENEAAISSNYSIFNCPSTPGGPRLQKHGYVDLEQRFNVYIPSAPGTVLDVTYASTDYQVINGIAEAFANSYYTGPKQKSLHGIMSDPNVCNRISDVVDGLSNTWMISERSGANDVWRGGEKIHSAANGVFVEAQADEKHFNIQTGGGWGDFENGNCWLAGSFADGTCPDGHGPCLIDCTNLNARGLYSFHPGGIHVLRGDGGVQMVSSMIETSIVVQAVTREGLTLGGEF